MKGTWPLGTATVTIANHGVWLQGETDDLAGSAGTILTYSGTGVALHVFSASIRIQKVRIESITIKAIGAAVSSASAIGLRLLTVEGALLYRLTVRDFEAGVGVVVATDSGAFRYTAQVVIFDSFVYQSKTGIYLTGASAASGVNTVQVMNTVVIGKTGPTAGSLGIVIDQFSGGNLVIGGDVETYETAFYIEGDDNSFIKTRTEDIGTTHVYFSPASSSNRLQDHLFTGGGTYVINSGGYTNRFFNNVGFVTESWNSTTISASTFVMVNHGLAGTPDTVIVTPLDAGYGTFYISARTSTTFTITVTVSGTYSFNWYARFQP